MTPLTRRIGPDMNRDTVTNVARAGFEFYREENVYFDVVKTIEARRPEDRSRRGETRQLTRSFAGSRRLR